MSTNYTPSGARELTLQEELDNEEKHKARIAMAEAALRVKDKKSLRDVLDSLGLLE